MRRGRRLTWIVFTLCALLVVDVLAWMTVQTLRLESRERESREQAQLTELVRRVLWDMESLVLPILTTESGRPYFHYQAFYPAERAYTRMFEELNPEDVLQPSPLLSGDAQFIRLHYEIDQNGTVRSPQAPSSNMQDMAESRGLRTGDQISFSRLRLLELEDMLAGDRFAKSAPLQTEANETTFGAPFQSQAEDEAFKQITESLSKDDFASRQQVLEQASNRDAQYYNVPAPRERARDDAQVGLEESDTKLGLAMLDEDEAKKELDLKAGRRAEKSDVSGVELRYEPVDGEMPVAGQVVLGEPAARMAGEVASREEDLRRSLTTPEFSPIWRRDLASSSPELFFERQVDVGGKVRTQGFWIDWPALRSSMLNAVVRTRPDVEDGIAGEFRADLIPMQEGDATSGALRLASVPVRLVPTMLPSTPNAGITTPIRVTLLVTWLATVVAIGSIAIVLRAATALSERRGRFVSAVTHELRTPMTTFRMYSEMLAGGMVSDEEKKARYLNTLRDEAGRLSRIVESVLAYARLDKTRERRTTGTVPAREVLDRITPELERGAERAGVALETDIAPEAMDVMVPADAEAIERICCNLFDNACKYGADAEPRVEFSVRVEGEQLRLRIRDFGPGVPWAERGRVFAAFDRANHEGDSQNPGLGLGLALSRGLARELGGDLVLIKHRGPGAMFELRLPISS